MKKILLLISPLLFLLLIIILYTFLSFRPGNKDNTMQTENQVTLTPIETISKSLGSLNILVDPRIELLTAVQQQSEYDILTQMNFSYQEEMKEYFQSAKKHDAVKLFKKMRKKGFSYDAPPSVMLYYSNPPNLEANLTLTDYLINRASGERSLTNFMDKLRDFSVETDFKAFYEEHTPLYQAMIEQVYLNLKDMELTEALDNYYGMEVNSYNLVLAPMLHAGGYGPRTEADNGLLNVYGILGPDRIITEQDGTSIPDYSLEGIQYLIWHEFSHSFVNPITEQYTTEINQYDELFSYIKDTMSSQAYDIWETCVNEHIVRAVTARLTYLYQGQEAYEAVISNERSRGFYYLPALCDSLTIYESSRSDYPTFESYYPELIKVFKELSEQELDDEFFQVDFTGPINSAFTSSGTKGVVIITPTNELDVQIQEDIGAYVKKVAEFFDKAQIITDEDALEMELGDYTILAYGTLEGNLWLKHYQDTFPFQVEENKIVADKTYEDTGLVLISALPNPQNYKTPLVVYTAQEVKDIININNVFHGPTDYIIAKNGEEQGSGFYSKEKEDWTFQE